MPLPLEGIRVIANTYTWAGPYAMMMLADMGAEVIRVESIQRWQWNTRGFMARPTKEQAAVLMGPMGAAYPNRDPGPRPWNRHAMFNSHARNKKSFTVDLATPEGVDIFKQLVAQSDAVVENSTPGVMDKLGVGYEALRRVRPDLVMVSSSGMGAAGPYAGHRGFGSQMEDLSGFTWLRCYPDGDPADTSLSNHSDAAGGAGIAFAVLAALHYRNRTGRGQWVDMSQSENLIGQIPDAVMDDNPLSTHFQLGEVGYDSVECLCIAATFSMVLSTAKGWSFPPCNAGRVVKDRGHARRPPRVGEKSISFPARNQGESRLEWSGRDHHGEQHRCRREYVLRPLNGCSPQHDSDLLYVLTCS
ncbi:MAG: CoA transferase [Chloroflexi bacterium]|nr:CoA transferase [Chloroflexota bacterium]